MRDNDTSYLDTGWAAESELIADTFDTAVLLIRSTAGIDEGKFLLENLATILQNAVNSPSPSRVLRDSLERLSIEAVKNKVRKEEMLSMRAARAYMENSKIKKDEVFKKKEVLSKEAKVIKMMRSKQSTFSTIAEYLNYRYKSQIKSSGCAPFSATDVYRSSNKGEKKS